MKWEECSSCCEEFRVITESLEKTTFCPFCGTELDEVDEEDEDYED